MLRGKFTLLFMMLGLLLAVPAVAFADNLVNDISSVGDRTITAGSSTTIDYKINANGGDGLPGCNASDGTPATVTLSVPTGVTASTNSLTFNACNAFQSVTFSSNTSGNYPINVSSISDTGTGSYTNQANFTLVVNDNCPSGDTSGNLQDGKCTSNTAPDVSVSGVNNGASYEFGSVPAASCSVTDAEDTDEKATPEFDKTGLDSYGLGTVKVKCSYTDGGGLSDSEEVSYTIVDTGKPVITDLGATANATGDNGWYTSAVTNTFKAQDYDANGNTGAGFAGETNPYNFTKGSGTSEGSAVKIASGTVSDVAGNEGASIDSAAFKIDLSDPTNVQFVGGPAAGNSYDFGNVPAQPTCTAEDAVSGIKSCVVTGYSSAVGTHEMTATATDNAGRTTQVKRSYTVLAWTLKGFFNPVDYDANGTTVWNTVKGGSTVPLKFEVFAGSTELTDPSVVYKFTATPVTCPNGSVTTDAIEILSTGGTTLRYDGTAGQFIQNWQTPKKPGACYDVTMTTDDGTSLPVAHFQLK
jgi:hypothetical protein